AFAATPRPMAAARPGSRRLKRLRRLAYTLLPRSGRQRAFRHDTLFADPQYRAWRMRVPSCFVFSIGIGLLSALAVTAVAPTSARAQPHPPGVKLDVSAAEIRKAKP